MRIQGLELINFRCFAHKSVQFSAGFNLLVGDNGTGKTTLLAALSVSAGSLLMGFDQRDKRHIEADDVRRVTYRKGDMVTVEQQYPVQVRAWGEIDGQTLSWARSLERKDGRTTTGEARAIRAVANAIQQGVRAGQDITLPLVSYYGTGRLWLQKRERSVEPIAPGSRFRGYLDCLDPASSHKQFLRWFKTAELIQLQRKEEVRGLAGVKAAIRCAMPEWEEVWFDIRENDIVARARDGRELPFRMLSDGVRNVLGIVADLAYRAAELNPHLGSEANLKTPGVVLIDELDSNLHPRWQRRVVEDLRRAFPEVQFFATTHSPFIIQSLRPGELVSLDPGPVGDYADRSIEDIAEGVQHVEVPQRSERHRRMMAAAEEYYRTLREAQGADSARLRELKDKLDRLVEPFADEPAYQAFLKVEREAAGLDSK